MGRTFESCLEQDEVPMVAVSNSAPALLAVRLSLLKVVAIQTDKPYIDTVESRRIVVLASTDGLQGLSFGALNRQRTVIPHSETASEALKDHHTFILF